jgi:hypothetical protein
MTYIKVKGQEKYLTRAADPKQQTIASSRLPLVAELPFPPMAYAIDGIRTAKELLERLIEMLLDVLPGCLDVRGHAPIRDRQIRQDI